MSTGTKATAAQKNMTTSSRQITPEIAAKFLETNTYERQRPLNNGHVMELAGQMRDGLFTHNDIVIGKLMQGDGKSYILNGQHTLWAIVESGVTLTLPVITYWVDTEEELNDIYTTIDTHKKRNLRDGFRAQGLDAELELELNELGRIASAVQLMLDGFSNSKRKVDKLRMMDAIKEWVPAYKAFIAVVTAEMRKRVLRRGVLAIALITFKKSPAKAAEFWDQVMRDDGLPQYEPRKVLNKWLLMTGAEDGRTTTEPDFESRIVAMCWNRWCKQEEIRQLRADVDKPLTLTGIKL